MRTVALSVAPLLFAFACVPDRSQETPGEWGSQHRDAGPDVTLAYECHASTLTEPLLTLALPPGSFDYAVWRTELFTTSGKATFFPIDERGATSDAVKARIASTWFCDAETCPEPKQAFELRSDGAWKLACYGADVGGAPAPGHYVQEIVVARGDDVRLVTLRKDLLELMGGTVDTKAKAVMIAYRDGHTGAVCNYDTIAEVEDGFDIELPAFDCTQVRGGDKEMIVLHVARDGHTSLVSRRPLVGRMP